MRLAFQLSERFFHEGFAAKVENSTHGNGWTLQIRYNQSSAFRSQDINYPPTAVSGFEPLR